MKNKPEKPAVLFIAYIFHPARIIGSVRTSKFAKYFQRNGFRVFVIKSSIERLIQRSECLSPDDFGRLTVKTMFPFDIHLARWMVYRVFRLFSSSGRKEAGSSRVAKSKKPSVIKKAFKSVIRTFPFSIFLAEGGLLFILWGTFSGSRWIRVHGIRYVFSTYSPFANHYIAWLLKIRFGDKICWIADFRDLHPEKMVGFFRWLNRRIDPFFIRKADHVITVSNGLKTALSRIHGEVKLVPNGFDPEEAPSPGETPIRDFSFTFTGTVYREQGNPGTLFQVLRKSLDERLVDPAELKIRYAGPSSSLMRRYVLDYGLTDHYEDHGFVDRNEALRLQRSSFYLVMLSFTTAIERGILTGKTFEYFLTRRPILYMVTGAGDPEIVKINQAVNFGLVVSDDDPEGKSRLLRFIVEGYKKYMAGSVGPYPYSEKVLQRYNFEKITRGLIELMKEGQGSGKSRS